MNWKEYQEKAALFFNSLGLEASVEKVVDGVRGTHEIDVYIKGKSYGVPFTWVVECKAWKSNIPKEKVLALSSIVQDVGADRGFLLSEVGFQSGAIKATKSSNITLTSLEDLKFNVGEDLEELTVTSYVWRSTRALQRIRAFKRKMDEGEFYGRCLPTLGRLGLLQLVLEDAANGTYPNIYAVDGEVRHEANNFEELVQGIEPIIAEGEALAEVLENEI